MQFNLKSNFVEVLKNYTTFSGRARRREYWCYCLFVVAVLIFLNILEGLIGISILCSGFLFAIIIPSIAVLARRMHDVGKGWFFMFIPVYNLYLACKEGTKGSNEFGADPKVYLFENHNLAFEKPLITKKWSKRKKYGIFVTIAISIIIIVFVCLALVALYFLLYALGSLSAGSR
jgi:uncharacterized membrane protein YhaH (DUF805 family)